MDSILLRDIRLSTRIGVPDEERQAPQTVLLTVEMRHPLAKAGKADDMSESIDYQAVTQAITTLAETERKTVECLAEDTAAMLLERFKPQGGVTVTVTKTPDLPLQSASVTIVRP